MAKTTYFTSPGVLPGADGNGPVSDLPKESPLLRFRVVRFEDFGA